MQFRRIRNMLIASAVVLVALGTPVFSQTAADTSSKDSSKRDDVSLLKQQIAEQQKQIEQLRAIVDQMKQKMDQSQNLAQTAATSEPNLNQVASTSPMVPKSVQQAAAKSDPKLVASAVFPPPAVTPPPHPDPEPLPMQFHIGTATITPIGFMDFTGVFRTHAAGGSIGTSFASIPYGSSVYQNNLSETRLSMQNSRIGFRVDADVNRRSRDRLYGGGLPGKQSRERRRDQQQQHAALALVLG